VKRHAPITRPAPVTPVRLDRRTLLRGAVSGLGASLALPLLDAMLDDRGLALAAPAAGRKSLPLRFGVFYWGGGVVHPQWVPTTTGTDFALPDSLQPFASLRPYLTVVTGMNHKWTTPGHIPARGVVLSSSHELAWMQTKEGPGFRGQEHPEPSVDALVAEAWRGQTMFDSLEIGICRKGPYAGNSSWKRGGTAFNRHEPSPQRLFDRVFGVTGKRLHTETAVTMTAAVQKSVLDGLVDETRVLAQRLGGRDRRRLEQHQSGLREIERRLQERERLRQAGGVPACAAMDGKAPPPRFDYGDGTGHEEKEAKSRVMSELLAAALACDLTRIFSYEWSGTQSHAVYWETGARMEHHPMNHAVGDSPEYARTITFIMKNYAYLAECLRRMPEGDGNVLDRTVIVGTSEHASAKRHNFRDHPLLLLGKAGGRLRAGQHYRDPDKENEHAPGVLLSAVRAVGVSCDRLGQADEVEPRAARDVIPELMA
jgi:hypothetical protein